LRCIDSLIPYDEGDILVEGSRVDGPREGVAMVFITHSIEEAVLMGDRVVVLKGRPSSMFEVIDVNLPASRDRSTLSHPRFSEVREHVWKTLLDEVRAAEFEV